MCVCVCTVCGGGVALMLMQHFVSLCHSPANFPPTFAFKSSCSGNVLSGLPPVASDTHPLTGRPKLLYLQRNSLAMNNTRSAKRWVGDKGVRTGVVAYFEPVRQENTVGKHKIDTSVVSDLSGRENAEPGIQRQDDSWRQVRCSSCIFLCIQNMIKILLDSLMVPENKFAETHALSISQRRIFSKSERPHSERSGPSSQEVINVVSALLKDTCLLCYAHMPGLNRSLALFRCTVG